MQDVRYAVRQFRANPVFTGIVVASLAFGIGANTAIFSLVDEVLLSRLPAKHPDQLVTIAWGGDEWPRDLNQSGSDAVDHSGYRLGSYSLAYPFFEQLQTDARSGNALSSVFGFAPLGTTRQNTTVSVDGEAARADVEMVAGDYFGGLGIGPLLGRTLVADDTRRQVTAAVLSYRYFARRFGSDVSAIGKRIAVNDVPFVVVGVMPPEFVGAEPGRTPDVWIPAIDSPALTPWGYRPPGNPSLMTVRTYWWVQVMGRLAPDASLRKVQVELDPAFQQFVHDALGEKIGARSMPHLLALAASRGRDHATHTYGKPLLILLAVVALVLLIACANVATLLLARGTARRREIAIRLSIGASRARLVRQLLTESVVLSALGAAAGLAVAAWGARALVLLLPATEQPDVAANPLQWRALLFTAVLAVATGVAFGLAPAIGATRPELARDVTPAAGGRRGFGSSLVVVQIAASLVLVFGAGLFIRSLTRLHEEDLGIDSRNLLIATIDPTQNGYAGQRLPALYETILERVRELPGVRAASASRLALFSGWVSNGPVSIPGVEPKPKGMSIHWNGVAPGFTETMGLRMRLGRPIGEEDVRDARPVAVINEAAAQYFFGNANPIGRTFRFGPSASVSSYEIVGVVQNAKYSSVRGPVPRTAYVPLTNMPASLGSLTIAVKTTTDPLGLAPALRKTLRDIDAGLALEGVKTEEEQVSASLWQDRLFADLMTAFGVVAVLLASVGLYGTMSYAVVRRTREIGVRMAVGARRSQVSWLVLRHALRLALIGIAVGAPLTFASTRVLSSQLFGVSAADPAVMSIAGAGLLAIMAAAAAWPAYRASRVDPLLALKAE